MVLPVKTNDIEISYKKTINGKSTKVVLAPSDYEIVSIKNNKLIGRATIVVRGRGKYAGEKQFTFDIKAKSIN
jgi:hypothetical protein